MKTTTRRNLVQIEENLQDELGQMVDQFLADNPEYLDRVLDKAIELAGLPRPQFIEEFLPQLLGRIYVEFSSG